MKTKIERHVCPVCGGKKLSFFTEGKPGGTTIGEKAIWMECENCGLVFQTDFYRRQWYQDVLDGAIVDRGAYVKDSHLGKELEKRIAGQMEKQEAMTRYMRQGSLVVEVGFGGGVLLKLLTESGNWERVIGIEADRRAVLSAKERGLEVYWADITTKLPDIKLLADLVIITGVMEHTEQPMKFVAGASALVRDGGCLAMSFAAPEGRKRLVGSEWQYWREDAVKRLFGNTAIWEKSSIEYVTEREIYSWANKYKNGIME